MLKNIEKIILEEVRPVLFQHYGDIEVVSFNDGVLSVRLLGECKNCPASEQTVQNVVAKKIMEKIPEVKEVVLDNSVSDELMDFAKSILKKTNKNKKILRTILKLK